MANAWEQVDQIATEALVQLQDSLVITNLTARDKTADFNHTANGYSVGDTVRIKTRPDYEAKEFTNTIQIQEIRESARSMTIDKHFDVSVAITAKEKALDFESFAEQVIRPAVYRIAEKCDTYTGTKILEAAGLYTSDDLFADAADLAKARQAALWQQLDPTGRYCLVNDEIEAKLLGATYFNTYNNRGDSGASVFNEARMGRAMGMDFYTSLQFPQWSLAAAGVGTTTTNNGTPSNGVYPNNKIGVKTLTVAAITGTGGIPAGTRIKIAGVRRPMIVAATAAVDDTTISLVDPITEIVPHNAAVTIVGSGQTNLSAKGAIFDSESLAVAFPVLDSPSDKPSWVVNDNGFSIRVVQGYDMTTKTETMSLDLLMGAKAYDHRRITLLAEH